MQVSGGTRDRAIAVPEPDVAVVVVVNVDHRRLDGQELRLPWCDVLRFRDGLVADHRVHMEIVPVHDGS